MLISRKIWVTEKFCNFHTIECKNLQNSTFFLLIWVDPFRDVARRQEEQENSVSSKIETFFFHLIRSFPFELNYSIGNVVALALFSTHPWDGEIAFLFLFFLLLLLPVPLLWYYLSAQKANDPSWAWLLGWCKFHFWITQTNR